MCKDISKSMNAQEPQGVLIIRLILAGEKKIICSEMGQKLLTNGRKFLDSDSICHPIVLKCSNLHTPPGHTRQSTNVITD